MPTDTKNFSLWVNQKTELEQNLSRLNFREREVWSCYWGCNIGYELDGKSDFLRPILIIKKVSPETFLAVPLTSRLKDGSWYHKSNVEGKEGRFVLPQIRMVDAKRLKYFISRLNETDFKSVRQAFIKFIIS